MYESIGNEGHNHVLCGTTCQRSKSGAPYQFSARPVRLAQLSPTLPNVQSVAATFKIDATRDDDNSAIRSDPVLTRNGTLNR
jgi:hypothetical protein